MNRANSALVAGLVVLGVTVSAGQGTGSNPITPAALMNLEFRSIGPTLTTGRVADITVDPNRPDVYYVASAVGGLWKSENRGDTWKSVFDDGGSFNMCCVVVDPKDSNVVWLGTGENSNPRSSTYGDGVYKSTDGGDHFARVGLETSEHIGAIKIDPRNSDVVWIASQGPLWSSGGDRGVFKTTDGGKTWKAVYTISADTGANDLVIDPSLPDVVYASMWQRRRGVGQMVGGGPESAIVKTTDGGKTWTKLTKGLPPGDLGRIALGVDPKAKPTRVYALLNGLPGDSGFFRSDDAGVSFHRMGAPYGKAGVPEAISDQTQCDQPAGRRGAMRPRLARRLRLRRAVRHRRRRKAEDRPLRRREPRARTALEQVHRAGQPRAVVGRVAAAAAAATPAPTVAATLATTRSCLSTRSVRTPSGPPTPTSSGAATAAAAGRPCRT